MVFTGYFPSYQLVSCILVKNLCTLNESIKKRYSSFVFFFFKQRITYSNAVRWEECLESEEPTQPKFSCVTASKPFKLFVPQFSRL